MSWSLLNCITLLLPVSLFTLLLLLRPCIFPLAINNVMLQQSNIPSGPHYSCNGPRFLTIHQPCGRSPPRWSLPGSSSRGCQWQTWFPYQTCRWSGFVCWLQSLPASRSPRSLSRCLHLAERKKKRKKTYMSSDFFKGSPEDCQYPLWDTFFFLPSLEVQRMWCGYKVHVPALQPPEPPRGKGKPFLRIWQVCGDAAPADLFAKCHSGGDPLSFRRSTCLISD